MGPSHIKAVEAGVAHPTMRRHGPNSHVAAETGAAHLTTRRHDPKSHIAMEAGAAQPNRDQKWTKLDDKGAKCIFLGVSEHSKAYKLFNPITEKVIASRDVVFDEEKTWVWSGESKKQQQIPANFDATGDSIEQSLELDEIPPEDDLPADDQSPQIQRPRKRPSWMIDYFCKSEDQVADLMTKPLKRPGYDKLRSVLGVCSREGLAQE
ncbi:hypothetical protein MRB53_030666 [Persea americana]|uniref:Uncharacterized protein n=1 Tax=Persea americana TaxID=3435 RepID=A0ACC2KLZ7_PERAE|nr:hypothetical protein MRB53_030666 [Persea americana]